MCKPFDIEQAKSGKPVCTRGGVKVRIIAFDRDDPYFPIIALVSENGYERVETYKADGSWVGVEDELDLMMAD